MTVRFSPSFVSYVRLFSRPDTMTRDPRDSDSATFSAASRHTEHRRNSVSPSFQSLLWRSNVRGVDATVKLATAAPDGVNRSSGSAGRFPTMVRLVSPAATRSSCAWYGFEAQPTDAQRRARPVGAQCLSVRITLVRRTDSLR